jgi:hypothetical protein
MIVSQGENHRTIVRAAIRSGINCTLPRASSQAVAGESTNASSGGAALPWCQAVPSGCTIKLNFEAKIDEKSIGCINGGRCRD